MKDAPWVLYAPTLRSPGGIAALLSQLEAGVVLDAAIVSPDFGAVLGRDETKTLLVKSHVEGARTMHTYLKEHGVRRIWCGQNPVVPTAHMNVSFIQNHLMLHPTIAICSSRSFRMAIRIAATTALTWAQVARSDRVLVLNSSYPKVWRRIAKIAVIPNQLPLGHLRMTAKSPRSKEIAMVTSWERFRGAHVGIRGFKLSALAASGWRLQVVARSSDARYERECRTLAAATPGVHLIEDATPAQAQAVLSSASLALFPSVVEGSSMAFLEALVLGCVPVALKRTHYTEACKQAVDSTLIHWVGSRRTEEWARVLRMAAARLVEVEPGGAA